MTCRLTLILLALLWVSFDSTALAEGQDHGLPAAESGQRGIDFYPHPPPTPEQKREEAIRRWPKEFRSVEVKEASDTGCEYYCQCPGKSIAQVSFFLPFEKEPPEPKPLFPFFPFTQTKKALKGPEAKCEELKEEGEKRCDRFCEDSVAHVTGEKDLEPGEGDPEVEFADEFHQSGNWIGCYYHCIQTNGIKARIQMQLSESLFQELVKEEKVSDSPTIRSQCRRQIPSVRYFCGKLGPKKSDSDQGK